MIRKRPANRAATHGLPAFARPDGSCDRPLPHLWEGLELRIDARRDAYIGVTPIPPSSQFKTWRWAAKLSSGKKRISCGTHPTELLAAVAVAHMRQELKASTVLTLVVNPTAASSVPGPGSDDPTTNNMRACSAITAAAPAAASSSPPVSAPPWNRGAVCTSKGIGWPGARQAGFVDACLQQITHLKQLDHDVVDAPALDEDIRAYEAGIPEGKRGAHRAALQNWWQGASSVADFVSNLSELCSQSRRDLCACRARLAPRALRTCHAPRCKCPTCRSMLGVRALVQGGARSHGHDLRRGHQAALAVGAMCAGMRACKRVARQVRRPRLWGDAYDTHLAHRRDRVVPRRLPPLVRACTPSPPLQS